MIDNQVKEIKLDAEWIQLILEAKALGISKEEILSFLKGKREESINY